MDARLTERLRRALAVVDEHGTSGPRLMDDAQRLWQRAQALLRLGLLPNTADEEAIELACFALQLPLSSGRSLPAGKLGRTHLRDRTEQAAELLVGALGRDAPEELIDRVTNVLLAMPHRKPDPDEARLLADALSLGDFGVGGLFAQAMQLALQGDGLTQVEAASQKREQYGYWEARLKDFHFEPVRKLARQRLEQARLAAKLLSDELRGDVP